MQTYSVNIDGCNLTRKVKSVQSAVFFSYSVVTFISGHFHSKFKLPPICTDLFNVAVTFQPIKPFPSNMDTAESFV